MTDPVPQLQRRVRLLSLFLVVQLALVVLLVAWRFGDRDHADFDEITVHRINVEEPDGTLQWFGAQRAYFGTTDAGEAQLELKDAKGNSRLRLRVPPDGEPRVEMLDADGRVVRSLGPVP